MREKEMKKKEPVMGEITEENEKLLAEEVSETKSLLHDNSGVGVVEVILILVVLQQDSL